MRAEDAKVADIHTVPIDPSLLRAGGNYLIIGSDTRAFVDTKSDAAALRQRRPARPVSAPTRSWSPTSIPGSAPACSCRSRATCGCRSRATAPPRSTPRSPTAARSSRSRRSSRTSTSRSATTSRSTSQGFRNIVNAIGSVPIYFPAPARDHNSGLDDPDRRVPQLDGDQALAYVRSRYYEYVRRTASGSTDPTSDLGRIRRQQYFIRSLAQRGDHSRCSRNPLHVNKVARQDGDEPQPRQELGASDLRALVYAFRNTNPAAFPMYTLPATTRSATARACSSSTTRRRRRSSPGCAARHRRRAPVPEDRRRRRVQVTVENGSGRHGRRGRGRSTRSAPTASRRWARRRRRPLRLPGDRGPLRARRRGQGAAWCSRTSAARASSSRSARAPSGADVVVVLGQRLPAV